LISQNLGSWQGQANSHREGQVSGMNSNHRGGTALSRARQAAASLKPVARSSRAAAKHGVRTTRAWAAPQLDRTGHLVQDRLAPKVSSLLHSAAQRMEPGKPRQPRWRKMAGASMVTAAASAVAGAVLNRRRQNGTAPQDEQDSYQETAAPNGEVDPDRVPHAEG
jgi:hypothetical protein